jgi:flagellin
LTNADKANIKTEYDALGTQIGSINTNAKFNGQAIFSAVAKNFTVDDAGTQFAVTTGALTAPAAMGAASDGTAELAIIQAQVATVTTQRASLGAKQSQLNYISAGQSNYATNVTAAESRIRDVDVAKETTNFSRAQILVQSSTAMLSQANSLPQSVLKLLQ